MKRYFYNYQTIISFSSPVRNHYFKLRCVPSVSNNQRVISNSLYIPNVNSLSLDSDWRGNPIQYGNIMAPHQKFIYVSCGEVEVGDYRIPCVENPLLYTVSTLLTECSPEMIMLAVDKNDTLDKAMCICDAVYHHMHYRPGITTIGTPAESAFNSGCGVCQDFAHIMIAICRESGIIARYANGFIPGSGETHAWVEILVGNEWIGIDPTHNRIVESGYIKVADGRDASDCPVNRGVFTGNAIQISEIKVNVVYLE